MPGRSLGSSRRLTPGLSSCQLPVAVGPCRTCLEARSRAVRLRQHAEIETIASRGSRMGRMTLVLCGPCAGKEGARVRDAEVVAFSAFAHRFCAPIRTFDCGPRVPLCSRLARVLRYGASR